MFIPIPSPSPHPAHRVARLPRLGGPGPTEGDVRGERGYSEHLTDFLTAVRNRDRATKSPAEVAHQSCALVHLGEIAYRPSGRLNFDPQTETFVDNDEANAMLTKEYRQPFELPAA